MPELGTYGSVRGALSNERPYRDYNFAALHMSPSGTKRTCGDRHPMSAIGGRSGLKAGTAH